MKVLERDLFEKYALLNEPTDPRLIKTRDVGYGKSKATLSYITGPTVIDKLNKVFGPLWDLEVLDSFVQPGVSKDETVYDKSTNKSSKTGNKLEQGPVAHVKVRLTVYFPADDGYFPVKKEAFGCQSVIGGQSEQENIFKGAATDGMKKAAAMLGIGLDLARSEDAQALFDEENYVDPWTTEELENHKDEIDYIKAVVENSNWTDEDLNEYVVSFSEGVYQSYQSLTPEIMTAFYGWLKGLVDQQVEAADGVQQ